MFCRDKEPRRWPPLFIVMIILPALREDRGFPLFQRHAYCNFYYFCSGEVSARIVLPFFFKPTDIHSIGFLRFRLFFRMIY